MSQQVRSQHADVGQIPGGQRAPASAVAGQAVDGQHPGAARRAVAVQMEVVAHGPYAATMGSELTLCCLGAADTVTGSKHLLEAAGTRILVDCGLFQGVKNLREQNWDRLAVDPSTIDAVVLTHAHLDHSGYLPRLVRQGFRGRIFATAATAAVAEIILRDSASLQERDAEFLNRHKATKHHPALPLYDSEDAQRAIDLLTTRPSGTSSTCRAPGGGHLPTRGAHPRRVDCRPALARPSARFTGDLGRYDDPVMLNPEPVPAADYLVMESTYGDRVHDRSDPAGTLATIIDTTVERAGTVVIPAFALGRAQTLLYYLWGYVVSGDCPMSRFTWTARMAINVSNLLRTFQNDHRLDPEIYEDMCAMAHYTQDAEESKKISASREPKIIISASGWPPAADSAPSQGVCPGSP